MNFLRIRDIFILYNDLLNKHPRDQFSFIRQQLSIENSEEFGFLRLDSDGELYVGPDVRNYVSSYIRPYGICIPLLKLKNRYLKLDRFNEQYNMNIPGNILTWSDDDCMMLTMTI